MNPNDMAAFSLRAHRLNAGLSPEALGDQIGVSGGTIRRLERGLTPTPAIAKRVADYVGKEVLELYPHLGERDTAA